MQADESALRRYVSELNERNFAVLDEVVADFVSMGPGENLTRYEYRQLILNRIERWPDYHVTVQEATSIGDEVILRWSVRGTDKETGESMSEQRVSGYRFLEGRIVEVRDVADRDEA